MTRTEQEQALERDFGNLAQAVLGAGETDDPAEIEARADEALARLAGPTVTARARRRRHATNARRRR